MTIPFLKVPAISVTQPIGQFFLCSIPASVLLKVTYSIPASMTRHEGMFAKIWGNQRAKSPPRAKQIGAYIDETGSTFPNSIILSANYLEDGSYSEEESLRWQVIKEENGFYSLVIPTEQRLASIIDGQHRLEGFKNVTKADRLSMELPCAVFINLPRPYQARIFATININQKRVDKSLAYELFGYDLNESDADKWPPDMLGVYLARILEGKEGSPFKNHIKLALLEEENAQQKPSEEENTPWAVSVACIVEGVTRLISDKPIVDRSLLASGEVDNRVNLPNDNAPLRKLYIDGADKSMLDLITSYFVVIDELIWKSQLKRSFITRTVGVLALFDVLREAIKVNRIDIDNIDSTTRILFKDVRGINFADDFFHASGAGRVRIKNVLKQITGLSETTDPIILTAVNRLVETKLSVDIPN